MGTRSLEREAVSGDVHLVQLFPNGVLVAVVDGVGHGSPAAAVSAKAVTVLSVYPHESVIALLMQCHRSLEGTRGAVISLVSFNAIEGTITWAGVGNVAGLLLRADPRTFPKSESLLPRAGIVGYGQPMLRSSVVPISQGDTLILATDGIRSGFGEGLALNDSPKKIADHILANHGKETDDALVLVVRYWGYAHEP